MARKKVPDAIMKSSLADQPWYLETEATDDESRKRYNGKKTIRRVQVDQRGRKR